MKAIIINRHQVPNASLLLSVLTESGKIEKLKIPGIFKSRNRNSFFLAPATVWSFTISGNYREIMTPREFCLDFTPFDYNSNYRDLSVIGELLKPLAHMKPDMENEALYQDMAQTLSDWICGNSSREEFLLNRFYLLFLKHMGLLHHSVNCVYCGKAMSDTDKYHLFSGSICTTCLQQQACKKDELIPNLWLTHFMENAVNIALNDIESAKLYRKNILMYLACSV